MHPKSISKAGLTLIKDFEGLHKVQDGKIHPYVCPAGVLTQGYGSTKGVKRGVTWTKEQASEVLMQDVNDHADAIYKNVKVELTQSQFDALVSFVFNLGAGAFKSSTLLKKLNKGLMDEVPAEFMKWNKARVNGKLTPLKGLTRRRTAEAAMFSKEESKDGFEKPAVRRAPWTLPGSRFNLVEITAKDCIWGCPRNWSLVC